MPLLSKGPIQNLTKIKMKIITLYFASLVILLSSCSRTEEIIALSKGFFYSLSDSTYACPNDYYPYYGSLNIEAKSDAVDIDESEIQTKGDTVIVTCFNNYTTSDGTFKQDSVLLYLTTNQSNQFYICNSKGLLTIDDDLKKYGIVTGALPPLTLNDRELAERYSTVKKMWQNEYIKVYRMLLEKVKVQNWFWKTSYSGGAHGEGVVINNLDFSINGIKYILTYFDYRGNFMAEDNGSISKTLYPGEKYNFSFWSSNAKNPDKAYLTLLFPDRVIYKIIKEQAYTGKEYDRYINELKNNCGREEKEENGINI